MDNKIQSRKEELRAQLKLLRRRALGIEETRELAAHVGKEKLSEAVPDLEELLDHSDDIVRYNSMSSLAYEFGTCSRPDRLREILFKDPDELCRGQAAGALGSLNRATRDEGLLRLFANIALDDSEDEHVRISAYTALQNVLGIPWGKRPSPFVPLELDQINWGLVRKHRG